ncbi:MAG TPA: aminotransferase class III-fold pyridoxal phosphate-dependent enzyme [Steroidobacteraceae bacterium]|nr:aminotransferase class III-fold pyridoxal phosphate-dependent enzyme [Steroidobacteraceae bacterium]
MNTLTWILIAAGAAGLAPLARRRLELSLAKHRSAAGHPRLARRVAALIPAYAYDDATFFRVDGAPPEVADRRRGGFERLAGTLAARHAAGAALAARVESGLSDLQLVNRYRVPFQFQGVVRARLNGSPFVAASSGVEVTDLDGNASYDLAGSYGVNVFGYDFYKDCIEQGSARVRALGPVLGAYHPLVADNLERLRRISGLEEVSFHMSGTEAVMQAVRLARYHTGRTHVVRFVGAYHGWWGDVQPGVGNPMPAQSTYTLKDMDEAALRVLRSRRDIACVLVNPLQALHPNASPPGDSALIASDRSASFDREAYAAWLARLREVCTERRIPLIFDEVFVGFRLAPGGAQEYFGVRADLVTYGKTLGGGLPVGVVCGRAELMRRYRDDRPADLCLARGTFNAHPYVMATMNEFLRALEERPEMRRLYDGLEETWNRRTAALNERLQLANLPVRVRNLSTIWTVCYLQPSRYNWMLQYYLRAEGLLLSWVGTGRFIFSLNYTEAQFDAVADRIVAAARAMQADGWWWAQPGITNREIRRGVLKELLRVRLGLAPLSAAPPREMPAPRAAGSVAPCDRA